eukprot:scaffold4717_cov66-Cyclotella_meneghiniana.AAC.5
MAIMTNTTKPTNGMTARGIKNAGQVRGSNGSNGNAHLVSEATFEMCVSVGHSDVDRSEAWLMIAFDSGCGSDRIEPVAFCGESLGSEISGSLSIEVRVKCFISKEAGRDCIDRNKNRLCFLLGRGRMPPVSKSSNRISSDKDGLIVLTCDEVNCGDVSDSLCGLSESHCCLLSLLCC